MILSVSTLMCCYTDLNLFSYWSFVPTSSVFLLIHVPADPMFVSPLILCSYCSYVLLILLVPTVPIFLSPYKPLFLLILCSYCSYVLLIILCSWSPMFRLLLTVRVPPAFTHWSYAVPTYSVFLRSRWCYILTDPVLLILCYPGCGLLTDLMSLSPYRSFVPTDPSTDIAGRARQMTESKKDLA